MKKRIITAIVLTLILAPVILISKLIRIFDVIAIVIAIAASFELVNMYSKEKPVHLAMKIINAFLTLLLMFSIINYFSNYGDDTIKDPISQSLMIQFLTFVKMDQFLTPVVALLTCFIIIMAIMVINPAYKMADVGKFFISIIYIGVCVGAVTILRYLGIRFVVYLLGITVCTDVFALVFGMSFGKHKMAPVTSPKKTWEGAIGGTAVATVVGICVILFYPHIINGCLKVTDALNISSLFNAERPVDGETFEFFDKVFRYREFTIMGKICFAFTLTVFLSVCSQIGDLLASKLKRTYGIKDYSNIFPGHGGILDRFDSLFFASAVFLLFILIEMNIFQWPFLA